MSGNLKHVTRREFLERTRSKAFILSTAASVLMVGAAIFLPEVLRNRVEKPVRVGVVGVGSESVRNTIEALTPSFDTSVNVSTISSRSIAETAIKSKKLDLAVVDGKEILVERADPESLTRTARFARSLSIAMTIDKPPLPITAVGVSKEKAKEKPPGNRGFAFMGMIVLWVFLITYNTWILTGVVEEKTSRIVETLLATMKPITLLTGKVIGIGTVALSQGTVVGVSGLAMAAAKGSNPFRGATLSAVGAFFLWFLLGYALYAFVYAAAGSTVSSIQDSQSIAFPLMLPLLFSYLVVIATGFSDDPNTPLMRVISIFPLTAPMAMPYRMTLGIAAAWEVLLAVLLMLGAIWGMVKISGVIYGRSILSIGRRVKLKEALRAG